MTEQEIAGTEIVVSQMFPALRKTKVTNMKVDSYALGSGIAAGADFKLHRPMGTNNERIKIGN